jgi:hypothetical protein
MTTTKSIRVIATTLMVLVGSIMSATAATFTVTNTNDAGAGSLRQAVLDSNTAAGSDTIVFDSSFNAAKTITLAATININPATGDSLTITGPGANLLTVSGNNAVEIFFVSDGDIASISGMKLTLGKNNNGGAAIDNRGNLTVANAAFVSNVTNNEGGAISTQGPLTVSNCAFSSNSASSGSAIAISGAGPVNISDSTFADHSAGNGGAISNGGVLNVSGCSFTNNTATSGSATGLGGGAIYSNSGTNATSVTNSTFTSNAETGGSGGGGAISNRSGPMTVSDSIFTSNIGTSGGAISNRGSLSVTRSRFTQNSATGPNAQVSGRGSGGAISSQGGGDLTITDSIISGNSAVNHGGGVYFQPNASAGPPMVITNTTISGNTANSDQSGAGDGGGISSDGTGPATITRSTISGNTAFSSGGSSGRGGGIYSLRKLTVDNCTVSGNAAGFDGGGIFDDYPGGSNSDVVITNSTIVFNQAANNGGGVRSSNSVGDAATSLGNTIVTQNAAVMGSDIFNPFGSQGFNLIGVDAKLGALADNGGPTKTHALLPGSPAIDQGKRLSAGTTDQRGVTRPFDDPTIANASGGDGSDIGAYEIGQFNGVAEKTLGNIATRLAVSTGDNVLIGGFIVVGQAPKRVIIRAIGPSLGVAGVNGALDDPTLELFQGSTSLAFNNDWRESQETEIAASGVAPSDNREAAIVRTLDPGAYTAIVRGNGNSTGIGLVDGYDLEQRPDSKLGNIATRGFVSTGDNVLIGGFIVGEATRVAVRAIGPSLSAAGISGPLQDPTLELVDAHGTVVRANDNWKGIQQADIEASGLQPSDYRESTVIETLTAGNYTAVVRGKNNTVGIAVVEAYNLQ